MIADHDQIMESYRWAYSKLHADHFDVFENGGAHPWDTISVPLNDLYGLVSGVAEYEKATRAEREGTRNG